MNRPCLAALALALCLPPRPAAADPQSGPDRQTIVARDWGTAYVVEKQLPQMRIETDMMNHKTFYARGSMTALDYSREGLGFAFPGQQSLSIDTEDGALVVRFGNRASTIRCSGDLVRLETAGDEVTWSRIGSKVVIQGRKATVKIEESANGFVISSPAGETRYLRQALDEPFRLEGVPVTAHPYMVRGVHFEHEGFGFFVDLHLERLGRAFTLLPWEPLQVERYVRP